MVDAQHSFNIHPLTGGPSDRSIFVHNNQIKCRSTLSFYYCLVFFFYGDSVTFSHLYLLKQLGSIWFTVNNEISFQMKRTAIAISGFPIAQIEACGHACIII